MKKYYFLAGLPRSGNTLLSSILNQNPEIKVSGNSFIDDYLYQTALFFYNEKFKNFPDEKSLGNLISNSFDSYYQDWDAKYIIDRGVWGTQSNLYLLKKYLKNEIKIICTVRDVVEIIASFIRVFKKELQSSLLEEISRNERFNLSYKSELELLCEIIMKPNGQVEKSLFSLQNLLMNESEDIFHIVEYNDLINDTEKTISNIYKFLNIEWFPHNFNKVEQFNIDGVKYNDTIYSENSTLHNLRPKISNADYKVSDFLTPELIQKYSNLEFWRD